MTEQPELPFPRSPSAGPASEPVLPASVEPWELLRLKLVPGLGPRLYQRLLQHFGGDAAILRASVRDLQQVEGIGPKLAASLVANSGERAAREEWQRIQEANCSLIAKSSPAYPEGLHRIPDPPSLLYVKGTILPADALGVAIVGSRQCTLYGRQTAERFAGSLVRAGVTVISGLARGIDASAHIGALKAGGRTIAVCATGLSTVYPPEHATLAEEIAASGALVTESPMLQAPIAGLFPQRNRIVSGMSLAVLLVEASRKSGALHTARHAMEQNREVLVVPGRIDSEASQGCLDLLRDGATLVRNVDDVLEALGPLTKPVAKSPKEVVHHPAELNLSEQEKTILNLVTNEPQQVDEVVRQSGLETSRVLATLTVLEMKRFIIRPPGGYVCRR